MSSCDYDVIIIGGSLSGASAATLLRRRDPALRVLVIERSEKFTRRVGEATVEISAFFLGRVLGLTKHLNEHHLVKQGMRFWYQNEHTTSLADASEIGSRYQVRLPSYQLDRAVFDEEVLKTARETGAEVWRPAQVLTVELGDGGEQSVTVRRGNDTTTLRSRWVIDASGVAAFLARQEGWWRQNPAHPTTAVWARWRGVKDWDGAELSAKYPDWAAAPYTIRGTATNHVIGDGWWSWWIPLKGGDTSIGIVFDQRLVDFPRDGGRVGDRLKSFLMQHPVARELLADATFIDDDVLLRKNLPYSSTRMFGDGFALVGDAAAFMDPFYSPGMDWISFTVSTAVELIMAVRDGEAAAPLAAEYDRRFLRSYDRWFTAVYRDKYEYMGDYELFRLAFQLDLGLYYMGIVSQPFIRGVGALTQPPFSTAPSVPFYHIMRTYNRRLAQIARRRRACGTHGMKNTGERHLLDGFSFNMGSGRSVAMALVSWLLLELREGWRTWLKPHAREPASMAAPVAASEAQAGT